MDRVTRHDQGADYFQISGQL